MKRCILLVVAVSALILLLALAPSCNSSDSNFVSYTANPSTENIVLYYKDGNGTRIGSLGNLKKHIEAKGKKLLFAMNGGMFTKQYHPLGLYIEDYKTITPLNTRNANGNFYMKPNGVLYFTQNKKAVICKTEDFKPSPAIQYATQSGPMLLIEGKTHPDFKKGSAYTNIRNGVGILPNGKVLFAMSKEKVNLYDFAQYFKSKGCKNALYLDGFVSRAYAPAQSWQQTDGNFGVMIGVSDK